MSHEDRLLTESHLVVLEVLLVADYSSPREFPSVHWDWDKLLRGAGLLNGGESVRVRETMASIDMSEVLRQRDAAKAETRRLLEGAPAGDLEQAVGMLCNDASARGVRIVMGPHRTLTPDDIRRAVGMLASSKQLALEKRDAALEDAEWHRKRCEELRHQVRVQSDENLRVKLEKREDWKAACEAALAASDLVGTLKARVAELEAAAKLAPAANAGGGSNHPVAWAELLGRLAEWDHMTTAADGPYWIGEIKKVLSGAAAPLEAAVMPKSVSGSIAESLENNGDTVAADGLRTERVTLEVTHRCVQPLADWLLQAIDQVLVGPGENVFVMDSSHEITKLTADLAASKRECERLRDVVRQLSVDQFRRVPIQRNESSTEAMKCMTQLRRERDAARARVAELEGAAKTAAKESSAVVANTCGDGGCGPARSGQNSGQAELEAAAGTAGGEVEG